MFWQLVQINRSGKYCIYCLCHVSNTEYMIDIKMSLSRKIRLIQLVLSYLWIGITYNRGYITSLVKQCHPWIDIAWFAFIVVPCPCRVTLFTVTVDTLSYGNITEIIMSGMSQSNLKSFPTFWKENTPRKFYIKISKNKHFTDRDVYKASF